MPTIVKYTDAIIIIEERNLASRNSRLALLKFSTLVQLLYTFNSQ